MKKEDNEKSFLYEVFPKEFIEKLDDMYLNEYEINDFMIGIERALIFKKEAHLKEEIFEKKKILKPHIELNQDFKEELAKIYVEFKLRSNKNKYELIREICCSKKGAIKGMQEFLNNLISNFVRLIISNILNKPKNK